VINSHGWPLAVMQIPTRIPCADAR
jgi:hypothetical protein